MGDIKKKKKRKNSIMYPSSVLSGNLLSSEMSTHANFSPEQKSFPDEWKFMSKTLNWLLENSVLEQDIKKKTQI